MGAVDQLVAVADHEQDRYPAHAAADEADHVEGGLVSPVQVLQHQDGRGGRFELGHQGGGDVMRLRAAVELGLELSAGGAGDVEQRAQGARGEQRIARGPEHAHGAAHRAAELAQQRRLADPSLAAHEHDGAMRAAGDLAQPVRELRQLSRALQELRAVEPRSAAHALHAPMIAARRRAFNRGDETQLRTSGRVVAPPGRSRVGS